MNITEMSGHISGCGANERHERSASASLQPLRRHIHHNISIVPLPVAGCRNVVYADPLCL